MDNLETVKRFYLMLDCDAGLHEEALGLQTKFPPEALMTEFVAMAARNGFVFTEEELAAYIFHFGSEVSE